MNKRMFLGSVLALLGTACVPKPGPISKGETQKTYVLVHGAWHGGWCWKYVKTILEAKGHRVYTPTLTGLGSRAHLNTRGVNLTTHMNDIVALIEAEKLSDIILVGHSYAGYIVDLVADQMKERISHIVYLDAALPKEGQSFIPEAGHAALLERYNEDYVLPVSGLAFLGIPETHEKAAWVKQNLTPHPLGTLLQPFVYENDGVKGLPKTFIRAADNPRYVNGDPVKEMTAQSPEWSYAVINTGHDAMVTAPNVLSDMLLDIG